MTDIFHGEREHTIETWLSRTPNEKVRKAKRVLLNRMAGCTLPNCAVCRENRAAIDVFAQIVREAVNDANEDKLHKVTQAMQRFRERLGYTA